MGFLSDPAVTLADVTEQQIVYRGFDRPDVEVLVAGAWWPGELRMWTQRDDETWSGSVEYRDAEGKRSGTFSAEQIREDTVDRSNGRR